jgi:hypothetical protein
MPSRDELFAELKAMQARIKEIEQQLLEFKGQDGSGPGKG